MEDWDEEEVQYWLRGVVKFPDEIVEKLTGLDGFTLVNMESSYLTDELNLLPGHSVRLKTRRDAHLKSEGNTHAGSSDIKTESKVQPSVDTLSVNRNQMERQNTNEEHLQKSKYRDKSAPEPGISDPTAMTTHPKHDFDSSSVSGRPKESGPRDSTKPHVTKKPSSKEKLHVKKLGQLLTGTEGGNLDSSFYPVLVINKPSNDMGLNTEKDVQEKLGFMSAVNWNVVFDCDPDSNSTSTGICHYIAEQRSIKILNLEDFSETKDVDILRERIDFPEVPAWVFPNGRYDLKEAHEEKMSSKDWTRYRCSNVQKTVQFFADPSVIPTGRAVVVFMLMSDSDFMVMSQIFKQFYISESFKDLQHFTVIANNEEILEKWVCNLHEQDIVDREEVKRRCVGGIQWEEINSCMVRLLGSIENRNPELPSSAKGMPCFLTKKQQNQWSDLSVLAKNECENTSMDDNNSDFKHFVQVKEEEFYQGQEVKWWNFYLSEKNHNKGMGFNHVLQRQSFTVLRDKVRKVLHRPGDKEEPITIVTIFHEPGAGGTTVTKNILWTFHREFRCAEVKRVTEDTVMQIMSFRSHGYLPDQKPGPTVLLLENLDSDTMRLFLIKLERETRYIKDDGIVFLLLHCKRTNEPKKLLEKESKNNTICVDVVHNLSPKERDWFKKKTDDLEKRLVFSEKDSPEHLLAFMVMKTECEESYLRNLVRGILPQGDPSKEEKNSLNLLKYIAMLFMRNPDFAMPVAACDGFMQKTVRLTYSGREYHTYTPWEKRRPHFLKLLLVEDFISDIDGCCKGLKIVHLKVAQEVLAQCSEMLNQTPADMFLELLEKSQILDTLSYSKGYIQRVCRDLMVHRLRKEDGHEEDSKFAPFIEEVFKEDRDKAIKMLDVGVKKFKDAFVAQQKARLHSIYERDWVRAEEAIDAALKLRRDNSYLYDTKGIILREKMSEFDPPHSEKELSDDEMTELLATFTSSCDAFQEAQQVMEKEATPNYAVFMSEVSSIFRFLDIVRKRVQPFCQGNHGLREFRKYLIDGKLPRDLIIPSLTNTENHDALKNLGQRVDIAFERVTDYQVQCGQTRFGAGQHNILDSKLAKYTEDRLRYFNQPYTSDESSVQYHAETACAARRAEVRMNLADGYIKIFELAQGRKVKTLKRVQILLRQNLKRPAYFDVKNLILTSFALAQCGEACDDESEVREWVNQLKGMEEKTRGLYGLFFEMLLNWPDEKGYRKEYRSIHYTINELNLRWKEQYSKSNVGSLTQKMHSRSMIQKRHSPMKPKTEFFLGNTHGMGRFVHRTSLGRTSYSTWNDPKRTKLLRRLDGVFKDDQKMTYMPQGTEKIDIKLSLPMKGLPSREPAQFFLGFSFAGPLAYDPKYKTKDTSTPFLARETQVKCPSYVYSGETVNTSDFDI